MKKLLLIPIVFLLLWIYFMYVFFQGCIDQNHLAYESLNKAYVITIPEDVYLSLSPAEKSAVILNSKRRE